jgi:hypothetical protein
MTPPRSSYLVAAAFAAAIGGDLSLQAEESPPPSGYKARDAKTVETPSGKLFALVGYDAPRIAGCIDELDAATRARRLLQHLLDVGAMLETGSLRLVERGTRDTRGLPEASLYIAGLDIADIMISKRAARRSNGGKHESRCKAPPQ